MFLYYALDRPGGLSYLKDEAQTAPEHTRVLHEHQPGAIRRRQRQIALLQEIAEIGGNFHAPRKAREKRDGLADVDVQSRLGTPAAGGIYGLGHGQADVGHLVA